MAVVTLLALLYTIFCASLASAQSVPNGFAADSSANANAPPGCTGPRGNNLNTFDFIIVGSGAAGSILANKLSAVGKVLLIEAGKPSQRDLGGTDYVVASFNNNPVTGAFTLGVPYTRYDVPIYYLSLFMDPQLAPLSEWPIPGGALCAKLIGGSMCHNGMLWIHPTQTDIAKWNVPSWNYANVLAAIQSAENVTGSQLQNQPGHGLSGPIQISNAAVLDYAETLFVNLSVSYGIPYNPNLDASPRYGTGYTNFNIKRGVRASSAMAYLLPALSNSNLTVISYAQVTRVLFSTCNNTKTATGVQFVITIAGTQFTFSAFARLEVILSAGTILSPWILINSGIGPAKQLAAFQKPVVLINENVGQHISNNLVVFMVYETKEYVPPNFWDYATQYNDYSKYGTGILANPSNSVAMVFLKTLSNLTDADIGLGFSLDAGSLYGQGLGIGVEALSPVYANGTVTLQSSDPTVVPVFTANLNASRADVNTLVRGIKAVRGIFSQPAAVNYFGREFVPSPAVATDAQLAAYVSANLGAYAHYVGSNKMGVAGDPTRVVDDHCRVVGVNNLRVVDASIIPSVVNGFPQATVVGVAIRGAAIIRADRGL